MPSPTYTFISKTVLGSPQKTVTLSGIPQTYTDLVCLMSARDTGTTSAHATLSFLYNNAASSYSELFLRVSNNSASANQDTGLGTGYLGVGLPSGLTTANSFTNSEYYFPSYTSTSGYKSLIGSQFSVSQNAIDSNMVPIALLRQNSAAISSLVFTAENNFATNTSFCLYGIKNS